MKHRNRRYKLHWQNIVRNAKYHLEETRNVKIPDNADDTKIAREYLQSCTARARAEFKRVALKRFPFVSSVCLLFSIAVGVLMLAPLLVYDITLACLWPLRLFLGWLHICKAERCYAMWFPNDEFAGFE